MESTPLGIVADISDDSAINPLPPDQIIDTMTPAIGEDAARQLVEIVIEADGPVTVVTTIQVEGNLNIPGGNHDQSQAANDDR